MRKLLSFVTMLTLAFTLGACEDLETLPEGYDISVTSEIESFDYALDVEEDGTLTLSLENYDEDAYTFLHWHDGEDVVSEDASFTESFEEGDYTFEAVFETVENDNDDDGNDDDTDNGEDTPSEPEEVYHTGFESEEASIYSSGTASFSGVEWDYTDAGNTVYDNQDLYEGDASMRLEDQGSIETLDGFESVHSIAFKAAYFMDDSQAQLELSLSSDGETWVSHDELDLTGELKLYEYTIDFSAIDGLSFEDAVFFRIESVDGRLNVDDFTVNASGEGATSPGDEDDEEDTGGDDPSIDEDGEFIDKENVALYLHTYSDLPDNYMSYGDFLDTGWDEEDLRDETGNDLMSLGDKDFHNYEGYLPEGYTYHSADINYDGGGSGGVERLVYSEKGHIYYTDDHYASFEELYLPEDSGNPDDGGDSGEDDPTDSGGDDPSLDTSLDELLDEDLINYYDDAEGLYGDDLKTTLQSIISTDVDPVSYDFAKQVLPESDRDPDNPDNVILVYTRESIKGPWDFPNWNREHVWPRSIGGRDNDVHQLKPSDVDENSARGSLPFGESGSTYEPPDEVKGDVARIAFYMDARYSDLSISSGGIGDLGTLLKWHFEDPVDDFERNRNDVIYDHQNNRNPFIDHPHLARLVYHDAPEADLDSMS